MTDAPEVSYTPGPAVLLSGPSTWLLMDSRPADPIVDKCWKLVHGDADVDDVLDAIFSAGIRALSSFALLHISGGSARVLARGQGTVSLTDYAGTAREIRAVGGAGWVDEGLAEHPAGAVLSLGPVTDGPDFPLTAGVVLAGSVHVGAVAPAVGHDRPGAVAPAAAVPSVAAPMPAAPATPPMPAAHPAAPPHPVPPPAPPSVPSLPPPAPQPAAPAVPATASFAAVPPPIPLTKPAAPPPVAEEVLEDAPSYDHLFGATLDPAAFEAMLAMQQEQDEAKAASPPPASAPLPDVSNWSTVNISDVGPPPVPAPPPAAPPPAAPAAAPAAQEDPGTRQVAPVQPPAANTDSQVIEAVPWKVEVPVEPGEVEQPRTGGFHVPFVPAPTPPRGGFPTPKPAPPTPPAGQAPSRQDEATNAFPAVLPPASPAGMPPVAGPTNAPPVGQTVDRANIPPPPPRIVGPSVHAVQCPSGHLNPTYAEACRLCGTPVPAQTPFEVARPVLGLLRLSTGDVVTLDRGVLMGRAPATPNSDRERPHVLRVAGDDISRNHVEVVLDGWHVLVRDLGSTNGTVVTQPGRQPQRLRPHEQTAIEPGTVVSIADVVTFRYELSQ